MLDIGIQELAVIGVLALLIFGPDKLPELGRRLGRAMREFRRASDEFRSTVEQNLQLNADISPPSPSPFEPPATTSAPEGPALADPATGPGADGALTADATEGVSPADAPIEPYWTSRSGRLLHRRECAWRARIPASERVAFKTVQDGWDQGLKACPACVPPETEASA
jgi:TatA/E family protein of Tat protein translocase